MYIHYIYVCYKYIRMYNIKCVYKNSKVYTYLPIFYYSIKTYFSHDLRRTILQPKIHLIFLKDYSHTYTSHR